MFNTEAGHELLAHFAGGEHPFPITPSRRQPSDADRLIRDVAQVRQLAGRVEARWLDGTLDVLSSGAAHVTYAALTELAPVLAALCSSVTAALLPRAGR